MKLKNAVVTVKEAAENNDDTRGYIKAYASVFDNVDRHGDVLRKGAFVDTIKSWEDSGNTLPLLYGHDFGDPFSNIGSVTSLVEDEKGLFIEATIDLDNAKARQVHRLLKEKRLTQMSYAFDVVEAGSVKVGDRQVYEITEVKLHEISVVPVGANEETEVIAVKEDDAPVTRREFDALVSRVEALERQDDSNEEPEDTQPGQPESPDNERSAKALMLAVDVIEHTVRG